MGLKEKAVMVSFNACAFYKNKLYSITNGESFPVVLDMETKNLSYLDDISNDDCMILPGGLDVAITVNDEIYFFGLDGDSVAIYNITTNSCETIHINCHVQDWGNFAAVTKIENDIILFSSYDANIVKINTQTHNVIYVGRIDHKLHQRAGEKRFSCGCRVDNSMWLFGNDQVVMEYDMVSGKCKEHFLPVQMKEYADVIYRDNVFYLLGIDGQVINWNLQNNRTKRLVEKQNREAGFMRMLPTYCNIWLLPALGNDIYVIDDRTEAVTIYQSYPKDFEYIGSAEWSKYYGYCEDENRYYLAMRLTNYMLSIDKKTGKEQWLKFELPTEKEYIFQFTKRKKIINESEFTLQNYLVGI